MEKYQTEIMIKIPFADEELDMKEIFKALKKLTADDYLKLYQLMYQDMQEHQMIRIDDYKEV